ncbi:MAG: hypothetical protein M3Q18_11925 [Actinomycetota bacterium]|nr:hypothetical protein [Actinomycetota bacterium]
MRERGSEADWQAYLRVERFELRGALEVAMLLGSNLDHLAYPWTGAVANLNGDQWGPNLEGLFYPSALKGPLTWGNRAWTRGELNP